MCKQKKIITEFPYEVKVTENIWIPMSDGTRLSARIWQPVTDEKVPAILEYIPYRKNDGTRMRDEPMHGYFSGMGYCVVRVDMRGSGESYGFLKDEYILQEQNDALECIDWISRQPWCTGDVGMMGKSWGGFNSLQVAARQPAALRAIICLGFTDDRFNEDIHYKGGCLLNDNFWWGSIMLAYQCRPIEEKICPDDWYDRWIERLEAMPLWMKTWMEHPTKDAYWKHGSVSEDYGAIKVPVLAIDGWQDAYTNTVLSLMQGLSVPRKAIIGPWAHVYPHDGMPAPAMNFLKEATGWWDHWLKKKENDVMDGPMVQVWMEESMKPEAVHPVSKGRWVGLNGWPEACVSETWYGLKPHGLKEKEEQISTTVQLNTPQNHGLLSGEWMGAGVPGESPADQRLDDGMAMVFETEPLKEDREILGYPRLTLQFSADKPKALLFAQLSDVDERGAVTRVSYGILNLTHRNSQEEIQLLVPGEKTGAQVRMDCCAHHFPKGHRIRLSLATTFWPMFWNMPEDATLTIDLSEAKLMLPIFSGSDCQGPDMQPESAPLTPHTMLKEGHVARCLQYDVLTDTWTCVTDGVGGVFGEGVYRFDDIDVTVEHNLKRELTLSNADPLSARYVITQKMKIGRKNWMTDADIVTELKGDMENFYITARMDIKENDASVFHKVWEEKVPRKGL